MSKADQRDAHRYEVLKRSVVDLGLFRRGSLVRRFMPCGKSGCRCLAAPPKLHGPYYQWTRKVGGKTVTVRLSQQEAQLVQNMLKAVNVKVSIEAVPSDDFFPAFSMALTRMLVASYAWAWNDAVGSVPNCALYAGRNWLA